MKSLQWLKEADDFIAAAEVARLEQQYNLPSPETVGVFETKREEFFGPVNVSYGGYILNQHNLNEMRAEILRQRAEWLKRHGFNR